MGVYAVMLLCLNVTKALILLASGGEDPFLNVEVHKGHNVCSVGS